MKKLGKTVAIIEARMTSSRLPGKVLMKILGKPVLQLLCERVMDCNYIDEIIIATTTNETDQPVEDLANTIGVSCFRGSEPDVLKRVSDAAQFFNADTCICITGDCPLIDGEIISQLIDTYRYNECDRAECNPPEKVLYPDGLGCHILSSKDLLSAVTNGELSEDREHVVWYFRRNPNKYKCVFLPPQLSIQRPEYEITLDEEADFLLIKKIFESLYSENKMFSARDIILFLDMNPRIAEMNNRVKRKNVSKM